MRCDVSFAPRRKRVKARAVDLASLTPERAARDTCRTVANARSIERGPSKDRSCCASASNPRASDVNAASRGGLT